ncbi:MAG: 50S ribosome-binding GTPase [Erysipelotrichaceae bacterium]|nr:50S ribosome-binding GTPase [Erysipelotrichaceae bacterium]
MEKKCRGCGIELQNSNKDALGYVVDLNMDYCQRCFRMTHYDAHLIKDFIPDNEKILDDLEKLDGQYIWVIDVFDLDTSLRSSLVSFYRQHECTIILNKCDLLPHNINLDKLAAYVLERIGQIDVRCSRIVTRGINRDFRESLESVIDIERPLIITGVANTGKSTVINELIGQNILTVNSYPATTMRINEITSERYHIYDSAGLWMSESMQAWLNVDDLRLAVPQKTVRPTVYQLENGQSLSLAGLARLDMEFNGRYTAVSYLSNQLSVHRGKKEKAEQLWNANYGKDDLRPIPMDTDYPPGFKHVRFHHEGKADYFICGLGFVTVTGESGTVDAYIPAGVQIIKRKAMI